jgi:hypothetical protein
VLYPYTRLSQPANLRPIVTMNTKLIITALLGTAFIFSIIELGLSAYIVSLTSTRYYSNSVYNYQLFASIWSLLVTSFFLAWPYLIHSRSSIAKNNNERWLAPLTLALNFVTMVFWLAAFASLADLYNGYNPQDEAGAQLAFAVMLWYVTPFPYAAYCEDLTVAVQAHLPRPHDPQPRRRIRHPLERTTGIFQNVQQSPRGWIAWGRT